MPSLSLKINEVNELLKKIRNGLIGVIVVYWFFLLAIPLGFPQGEFDVMYGFADLMTDEIEKVIKELKNSQKVEK